MTRLCTNSIRTSSIFWWNLYKIWSPFNWTFSILFEVLMKVIFRRIGEPKHQRSPANIKISLLKKETLQAKKVTKDFVQIPPENKKLHRVEFVHNLVTLLKAEEEKRKFASDYDESKYADWENLNDFTDGQDEIEQTEDENVIRVMELGGRHTKFFGSKKGQNVF